MSTKIPTTPAPRRHGGSPLPPLIIGLALLALWVVATLLQIQTSEAFLLNGPAVTLVPNWGILTQVPDLVQGKLTPDLTKATIWGWGIELVYLSAMVGYEIAHDGVSRASRKLAGVFQTVSLALVAFDAYMDFRYGSLASGWGGTRGRACQRWKLCNRTGGQRSQQRRTSVCQRWSRPGTLVQPSPQKCNGHWRPTNVDIPPVERSPPQSASARPEPPN